MRARLFFLALAVCLVFVPVPGMGSDQGAGHDFGQAMHDHGAGGDAQESSHGDPMDHNVTDHSRMDHAAMDHDIKEPGSKEQDAMDHSQMDHELMLDTAQQEDPDLAARVRVDERLGEYVDFSARFVDDQNRPVDLRQIFDKPVVILPVYFMCTSVCNFLQANLANALNLTDDIPGRDFNVVTVSFSDDEDASHARTSKRNYTNLITRDMDVSNWYYLTSDRENILKLTQSLGYYFVKTKKNFYIHPSVLVVLARDGKIIRYLYGPDFLPFDLGMALSEARKGEPGISIKRGVLSFCFDYDPENKTYVFKMFRITGTAILVILAGFVAFLVYPSRSGRKRGPRRGRQHGPPENQ